jgi:hypothetical protein
MSKHTPSTSSPPWLSTDFPTSTQVIPKLSPTGGKEWQFGHIAQINQGLSSLLFDAGGEFVDLVIDRTTLSH